MCISVHVPFQRVSFCHLLWSKRRRQPMIKDITLRMFRKLHYLVKEVKVKKQLTDFSHVYMLHHSEFVSGVRSMVIAIGLLSLYWLSFFFSFYFSFSFLLLLLLFLLLPFLTMTMTCLLYGHICMESIPDPFQISQ